jgi:PAS domain-containing protein
MSEPFSLNDIKALLRDKIIGLGERSTKKSYYAQLRQKLQEAEQARQKLAESEARYRRIVNTANEGIWVLTADWPTAFVNAKMAELLGLAPEEMLGRPITDFIFAEDAADHAERMG